MKSAKIFRKTEGNVLEQFLFETTAHLVDMEGFVPYTDQELTGTLPAIDTNGNVRDAIKILEGTIRKKYTSINSQYAGLATVAKTGNYADLNGTPTIPTKISDLEDENRLLRSLATTGIAINTYMHEIRALIHDLKMNSKRASEAYRIRNNIEEAVASILEVKSITTNPSGAAIAGLS